MDVIAERRYALPHGTPMYWKDCPVIVRASVIAYLEIVGSIADSYISVEALTTVADYVRYFLRAPCWTLRTAQSDLLAHALGRVRSVAELTRLVDVLLDHGIDPF